MKTHTNDYKNEIKTMGKQIDTIVSYTTDGVTTNLTNEELNAVTPSFEGNLLKSLMKQVVIDSNIDIPLKTQINVRFGVKVNGTYEYINYGNYIVYSTEKKEDTGSYEIKCYDKMLYAMKDYSSQGITYPISIRDYINTICGKIGLTFANINEEFANYDKLLTADVYEGLNYTYRDVLDELAQVTASNIIINSDDELEIKYISDTAVDTIDEEFLKDVNVNFG